MGPIKFDVANGPTKEELMAAFKCGCEKAHLEFTVVEYYTAPSGQPGDSFVELPMSDVKIIGFSCGDRSFMQVYLRGNCKAEICCLGSEGNPQTYGFEMYYNTKTQKGTITFTKWS